VTQTYVGVRQSIKLDKDYSNSYFFHYSPISNQRAQNFGFILFISISNQRAVNLIILLPKIKQSQDGRITKLVAAAD